MVVFKNIVQTIGKKFIYFQFKRKKIKIFFNIENMEINQYLENCSAFLIIVLHFRIQQEISRRKDRKMQWMRKIFLIC